MGTYRIPFNRPFVAGKELYHIAQAVLNGHTSGDGPFGKRCESLLESLFDVSHVLLTTSCSAAIDMASLACGIGEGDEVVLPSFAAAGTANVFRARGARIIFCDIRQDTFTIDLDALAAATTERTRAVVPHHYAGVSPDMDSLMEFARNRDLWVIEDAAEAFNARYRGRALGTIGQMGAFSFHEAKDFSCGEGGALVTNDDALFERAEVMREKGTNRSQFFRGQVDKYTWVELGSSYVPSDLLAAFLYGQLEELEPVTAARRAIYERYSERLAPLAHDNLVQLPTIPSACRSNFHRFHLLVPSAEDRTDLIAALARNSIMAVFHFQPLHLSQMGRKLGWRPGQFPVTESIAERIVRLPFYYGLTLTEVDQVCDAIVEYFSSLK